MKLITEYLSTKVAQTKIKATNSTIHKIVKDELDRLGHEADLNHIDVSGVTKMNNLFSCHNDALGLKYQDLNPDISGWDVSNVENMSCMFWFCENFNCNISSWDVGKVENMVSMFDGCIKFNQDLSQWNVNKVKRHSWMFDNCCIRERFKPKFN